MSSPEVEPLTHSCPSCSTLLDISEQEPYSKIQCPSCGTEMRVRTKFNQYELLEPIASGGMGTVYRAQDTSLNRVVALKLIRKEFSEDSEYTAKLETEAKVTASVSHPNVVKVYSFGCSQGIYYIAMELVDKGSLDDLMTLQGRIAEVQVLEIGIQAAEGLRSAYQAGLIHRDVKPGNILFADAHTAKIVDFGLAMPLEQAQEASEEIWGTPYYVAPEKLNHEPEDFRSDIYSLGGTLFHALAGRPPFEADNASLVALKHLKSQAVSLQTFAPDISSPTSYVINRTLAKNPNDRYQSYDELIEHLTYARTKLLESSGKQRQQKARVVVEGESQQKVMGYLMLGVIVLVVAGAGTLFYYKDSIMERNMTPAEREKVRMVKAANLAEGRFGVARNLILKGEATEAFPLLWMLDKRVALPQPLKNWVLFQQGISAYLAGMPLQAKAAFHSLGEDDYTSSKPDEQTLGTFFADVSRHMQRETPINENAVQDYAKGEYEPIALFAFALKEWNADRFQKAEVFFNLFLSANAGGQGEWVNSLKPVAQAYLSDYDTAKELLERLKKGAAAEKTALLPKVAAAKKALQQKGRLFDYLSSVERTLGPRTGASSYANLYEVATRAARDLDPEEGIKRIEGMKVEAFDQEAKSALLQQLAAVQSFKKRLIEDLSATNYEGTTFDQKVGQKIQGQLVKATESGIVVKTAQGEVPISWGNLSIEMVIRFASVKDDLQSTVEASSKQAEYFWGVGNYIALAKKPSDGLLLLCRAAEAKKEYAKLLPLFEYSRS